MRRLVLVLQETRSANPTTMPSSALQHRIWSQISLRQQSEEQAAVRGVSKHSRFRMAHKTAGLIAVATAAIGAAILLAPGTTPQATVAFAAVEQAMTTVDTVTYQMHDLKCLTAIRPDGSIEVQDRPRTWTIWARISSPALASLYSPHYRYVSYSHDNYQIDTSGPVCQYSYNDWGGITASPIFGAAQEQTPAERIRNEVLFNSSPPAASQQWQEPGLGRMPLRMQRSPWKSAETSLNGKRVLRYDCALQYQESMDRAHNAFRTGEDWSFWVDPQTHLVLRREIRTHYQGAGKKADTVSVADQFRYNETPPMGTFEVTPPLGSRFYFVPLPVRPANEQEQAAISRVIHQAVDAWNRKDVAAYGAAWDFGYLHFDNAQAEHERRLQIAKMEQGLPHRVIDVRQIPTAQSRITGRFIRRATTDPFPPREPVEFTTVLSVGDSAGKRSRGFVDVNLRRDGSDYRIIRWDYWPPQSPAHRDPTKTP